jgi:hypothetical protein
LFDPSSGRAIISVHVTFEENTFPYAATKLTSQTQPSQAIAKAKLLSIITPSVTSTVPENCAAKIPQQSAAPQTHANVALAIDFSPVVVPRKPDALLSPAATDLTSTASPSSIYTSSSTSSNAWSLPPHVITIPSPNNDHAMCTRDNRVFHLPTHHLNLTATQTVSPIPSFYKKNSRSSLVLSYA